MRRVNRLLKVLDQAFWVTHNKILAVWGAAFKPNTDDIREAPSLRVIPRLREQGAYLRIYDPQAGDRLARVHPSDGRLSYVESAYEAATGAHGIVILTGWDEFRYVDWSRLRALMRTPVIVDGRNLFDPAEMHARGFEYYSLGRGQTAVRPAPALLLA